MDFYDHESPATTIFIHGAGGNNLLWRRTLQGLSGRGRAIALNLPGHPSGEILCKSVDEYAAVVHDFITSEGIAPVSVCGHSMGSAIALSLALDRPRDVEGLILVGGGAKLAVSPSIIEGLSRMPLRAIEELITPMSFHSVDLEMGREARRALSLSNVKVFLNDYLACNNFDVRPRLRTLSARTLLVCGESDRMTPPRYTRYLNANIPDSTAHFIKGAGHMVPLEKPEALGALLQSFLFGVSR